MNRALTKFLADFGPLLVFFVIYFNSGQNLKLAIPPFIIATIIALLIIYILEKRIPMVPLTSGILITLFGGLTLYFDNNYRWICFFIFVAILNEIVWRTQSEVFRVNFKVWGLLPISFVFAASQVPLINKYKLKE